MEYLFTNPGYLKLLYALPIFWIVAIFGYNRLSVSRILLSTFLRSLVFLLIVLVLAGLSREEKSEREISAVFLVDVSDSITPEGREWMWDYVEEVGNGLDKKIKKGLVVFGGESRAITPTLTEDLELEDIHKRIAESNITSDRTDIASGIMATLGIMPEDSSKMAILLSDGNENLGEVLKAATMAAGNDVKFFVASPPQAPKEGEILIKKVVAPKEINEGEMFEVKVVIENRNDSAIKGNLKLNKKDGILKEWDTEFKSGISIFEVPYKSDEKGFVKFNANLSIEDVTLDKDEENNSMAAFVSISDKTRLLFINGAENQKMYLPEALEDKTIPCRHKKTRDRYLIHCRNILNMTA